MIKRTKKTSAKTAPISQPAPEKKTVQEEKRPHIVTEEENLPDGALILTLILPGRVATKKTSQRVVRLGRRTVILPSQQYMDYEKHCQPYVEAAWKNAGKPPMDFGVALSIRVALPTWTTPDHAGVIQSLGDILEKHELLGNDKYICWMQRDNQHFLLPLDKINPLVEIEIRRFRHPCEIHRAEQEQEEQAKQARAKVRAEKAAVKAAV